MPVILADDWGFDAWAWLVVPLALYCVASLALFALGRNDRPGFSNFFFGRISDSLRRLTGFPGWAMAGVLSGLVFLFIVVVGFYWDVAWHIDYGRDVQLFTPSHTMILVGLSGLVFSAFLAMGFATLDRAEVGFKHGVDAVPWSSVLLLGLGFGGMAAVPLDNLWHQAYGIDFTVWSPTHLQLVAGGALGTLALFLMLAEAMPSARPTVIGRAILVLTGGTVLVGLSSVQVEFDYGVPQFQVVYLPLLIMVAAGIALVLARIALGPWGAVKMTLVYLGLRGFLALVVGGVLNHAVPRFPLYLVSALAVEGAATLVGTRSRLRFGLVAGGLVGTVGSVGELAWVRLSGWQPMPIPASMAVTVLLLAPVAAMAAALLGAGLGRAFSVGDGSRDRRDRRDRRERMPTAALVGAGVVLVAVLAYPLPRHVGSVDAVIRTDMAGGDRAFVEVALDPPGAAREATVFAVTSWQGGGKVTSFFDEVGPGRYRSEKAVPVTGTWKTAVTLQRGSEVMATPVHLPAEPTVGAESVPLVPERRARFVRNTTVLLREQHRGAAWPKVAAWSGLVVLVAVSVGLMAVTTLRASTGGQPDIGELPVRRGRTDSTTVPIGEPLARHGH